MMEALFKTDDNRGLEQHDQDPGLVVHRRAYGEVGIQVEVSNFGSCIQKTSSSGTHQV